MRRKSVRARNKNPSKEENPWGVEFFSQSYLAKGGEKIKKAIGTPKQGG
jgi:hypothetical protein